LILFYIYLFVVMGRPQDIFTFIAPLRPVLILEVFILCLVLISSSQLFSQVFCRNRQVNLFLALICVMIIGVPFAYHRGLAFEFLFTGYVTLIFFFLFFFIFATSAQVVKTILKIVCLGVFIYTMFSIVQGTLNQGRLGAGTMFDPNDLSYFLVSLLPFNFLFVVRGNPFYIRCVSILNIGFGSLTVLMTGSRGGFIGLLGIFTMLLFLRTRTIKLGLKVVFLVSFLILMFFMSNSINFDRLGTILSLETDYNITAEGGRLDIWKTGLKLMITHPLTGVGVNCFDMAIGQDREERGTIPRWQTAHNSFVLIGTETGVVGLLLYFLLNLNAYIIFSKIAKNNESDELARVGEMARIGFVGNFVCSMFLSQAYSVYWVFYIALSAVLLRFFKGEEQQREVEARRVL
jgi:O-antigen ligase